MTHYPPLALTTTIPHCLIKIQIGIIFLLPAYRGCQGKKAVKWIQSLCRGETGRLRRDLVWIRNMNQYEGSYQLSHVWDSLLTADVRNWKLFLMQATDQ